MCRVYVEIRFKESGDENRGPKKRTKKRTTPTIVGHGDGLKLG